MWHEARKQERKIRGMLVDYRKRAERRRDFYEKIKADPTQFLQIHGRQCKIHLDPAIAAAADSTVMMSWQGNDTNLIDRFDVRAHLDIILPVMKDDDLDLTQEERQLNYERYRIIAQNAYLGITEEKFLKQLHMEEQFGYTEMKIKKETKSSSSAGAAIGFNYEDGTAVVNPPLPLEPTEDFEADNNSDSDLDVDLAINVSKIDPNQAHDMNKNGQQFGMAGNDFYSFLTNDMEEAESFKLAKEEEHEKSLYSGRKSRRERRAHREKRLANRTISPPSYAAKECATSAFVKDESKSPSRSPSPPDAGKITYITSFGDDEEPTTSSKISYADKVKYGKSKQKIVKRSRSREIPYERRTISSNRYRSRSRSKCGRKLSYSRSPPHSSRASKRRRSNTGSSSSASSSSISSSSSSDRNRKRSSCSSSSSPLSSSSLSSDSPTHNTKSSQPRLSHSSKSKSRSKSPTAPSPPRIRYYGRKKSDVSSSESSSSEDNTNNLPGSSDSSNIVNNNSDNVSKKASSTLTVIERLKLKRQTLINRQFKKDKIAEVQKILREKQAQQNREDELREMAIKLRRRQRELRHAYDDRSSSSDSEKSDTSTKRRKSAGSPGKSEDMKEDREKTKMKREEESHDRAKHSRNSNKKITKKSRSRSRSRRRFDKDNRCRTPEGKNSAKKLVDY